ncbi:hypothetical protein ACPPVW_18645 [Leifsonia sp. McL0607]|uniref:hypothetical protein n=1 Tax=Leifsonia sp. McL0607 TaxID=3415672 RepID=UPI003CF6356A
MTNSNPKGELVCFPAPTRPSLPVEAYQDPRVICDVREGDHLVAVGTYPRDVDPRRAAQAVGALEPVQPNGPANGIWHGEVPEWNLSIRMVPAADDAPMPASAEMETENSTFSFSGKRDEISRRNDKAERRRQLRFAAHMLEQGFRPSNTVIGTDDRAGRRIETDYYVQDPDLLLAAHARRHHARRDAQAAERQGWSMAQVAR